jgi:Galactose oxidase-like, Early set domain
VKELNYHIEFPNDSGIEPPGWWMLFAINNQGVPSHAESIEIRLPDKSRLSKATGDSTVVMTQEHTHAASAQSTAYVPPVRTFHPRLFATEKEWDELPQAIASDFYLTQWHENISKLAENWRNEPCVNYSIDGLAGNGVLDTARDVQLCAKYWLTCFE